jgi:hypothetical protein
VQVPFAEYSARVEEELEHSYGIRVVTRDIAWKKGVQGYLSAGRLLAAADYEGVATVTDAAVEMIHGQCT